MTDIVKEKSELMNSVIGLNHRRKPTTPIERERKFWSRVVQVSDTGCWIWNGSTKDGKYGLFGLNGEKIRAHRVAWEFCYGEIPENLCVCHKCDVPFCVNPSHLFLGTPQENTADMVSKGRSARGSSASRTKLREEDVAFILENYRPWSRVMGAPSLASRFGVTHQSIMHVVKGKSWKYFNG